MDIKMLLTTFGLIFLAELGDKTQLATFASQPIATPGLQCFWGRPGRWC